MIKYVGLSCIIESKKHLKFDIDHHCTKWMQKFPWYNTTILLQLSGHNFKYYFTKGYKDNDALLCAVDAYDWIHLSGTVDTSSGSGIPFTSKLSIDSL